MNWPTAALAEVAEIVSGGTPKSDVREYWDGGVPWVTPKDLSALTGSYIEETPRTISKLGLEKSSASLLPANSVLFSSRAPIGHVAINSVPMATNQGFKSFVPFPERLNAKYLYHWLRKNRAYLESLGNGATFKEVSKAVVSAIEIPLPPLPEQRRIAAILDHAEALRVKRREAIVRLDELIGATFSDIFGDGSIVEQTRSVGDVCSLVVDCVNKTAPTVDFPTPYRMIRTSNVRNARVDLESVRYVTADVFDRWTRRVLPVPGDVLLTREAPVGEVGLLEESGRVFLGQRLMLYRADPQYLVPDYLLYALKSPFVQRQFGRFESGSTVKHLSVPVCRQLEVPVPEIGVQHEFAERIACIRGLATKAQGQDVNALFNALQSRAFRGEL